ncbi:MAG: branched-chain amino acid ABC transporter permease, partial [Alcaligenaceae bacterium]|nr:branched-chain amino acid ABC transporter permease [Alcaligenaceae bacterium]
MKKLALTLVVLLVLVTLPYWLADQYYLHIVITTGLFIVGAMSLNLLLGYTGQLNLGHIAFFGIGAYVSALTSLGFEIAAPFGDGTLVVEPSSPFLGFVLATIIAGLFGFIIGKLSFKIRGAYFVIVT